MSEQTTTQKIAELKTLCGDVKSNMYQRVKLAFEILADVDWLEQAWKGRTSQAMDYLQREGFPYVTLTVGQLAAIYKKWPTEALWKEWDYDINLMWDELDHNKTPTRKSGQMISWKRRATELKTELDEERKKVATLERDVAELQGELRGIKETLHQGVPA